MSEMRIISSAELRVGDMWPRKGSMQLWGPIRRFDPQEPTEANGWASEVVTFADGTTMSLGDDVLVSVDELLEWRRNRGDDMTQFCRHGMRGPCEDNVVDWDAELAEFDEWLNGRSDRSAA